MNKQFIDGVLEVLREDGRQICKQAAHIIAELAEEIEALQSLSDFQRQQKSCMDSAIEKMKCCMNCDGQGDREDNYYCFLADCDNLSLWRLKDNK